MPLSRRYRPEWAPGESASIGMDFSPLIPPGVAITSGALVILTNTNPPQVSSDFTGDTTAPGTFVTQTEGRILYTKITGGALGKDYQLVWEAADTDGNIWPRVGLLLCAYTS